MTLKASISGIRGIIGESLTPQIITDYISSFSAILPDGDILLGRDSRPTGEMLSDIIKGVLNSLGRNVIDIGIVPTPVVLFGVLKKKFSGGIIITASHNPQEWNALKFVNSKGKFLSVSEFNNLEEKFRSKSFKYCSHNNIGKSIIQDDIADDHINTILNFINQELIKKSKFRVALDSVNGAGGPHTIKFLKKLGCEIVDINSETTGIFSHPPEPKPENLSDLSKLIKDNSVDIGFALDPDADRLVIADEKGNVISEELTLALSVFHYLKNYKKSDVVINLSSSRVTEDIASEFNCNVVRVPTGEINVTEKMEEINAKIGGEGNGGVILTELNKCRDSLVGIGLILELMSYEKKSIRDILKGFHNYILIKEKISAKGLNFDKIFNKIKIEFKDQNIDTQDGIRVDYNDKWVLMRMSNTEPIIRIFAESKEEKVSLELIDRVKKLLI